MSKLAQVLEWLKVAMEIARFINSIIPGEGKSVEKREVGETLMALARMGDVDDGKLIDAAVQSLKATGEFK